MSNILHSAAKGEWYTPEKWIKIFTKILGGQIDLDPCSCSLANETVRAARYYTSADNPLSGTWPSSCFVNPPGSCDKKDGLFSVCGNPTRCSCKLPLRFMEFAYRERLTGSNTIYLAYSVNQLRQLSSLGTHATDISVALPPNRIAYLDSETMVPGRGTPCDSAVILFSTDDSIHRIFATELAATGCFVSRQVV